MKQHVVNYHSVPRGTFEKVAELTANHRSVLDSYLTQLLWWNKRINLVSRGVSRETISEHIRHSLLLTQLNAYKTENYIVDTGTGGGLPGLPLSIVSSDKNFLLNDIVSKKTLALKQIVREIGVKNVEVRAGSVSELTINESHLLISKHAFKVNELINLANDLPWSAMVFYKGIDFKSEIASIQLPLVIDVYDLHENSSETFYEGKSLIHVARQ